MKDSLLPALAALLLPFHSIAYTTTVNGIAWTYTLTDNDASLGGGTYNSPTVPTSTTRALSIPSALSGHRVSSIGDHAFRNCSAIPSIAIPDCVTNIGGWAFYKCSGLSSITIPKNVEQLGYMAFCDCQGLQSVAIGNSVQRIGDYCFSGCSELTSVTIPNCVKNIGRGAFNDCYNLALIPIPNSVECIGSGAFRNCSSLSAITIPASVTNIADGAFEGCSNLQSLQLPLRFHGKASGMGIPPGCTVEFRGVCALSVSSAFGHPVPEVGRHAVEVVVPTMLSCSVEETIATENPGERYACTGWTGSGSVPASGTGTNATFEIEVDSSIEWNWETNVWIECAVTGDATSAGLAAWLVKDGAAAAVPFAVGGSPLSWTVSGDADGVSVDPDAGRITIPADRPRSVAVAVTHHTTTNSVETGEPAVWSGVGAAAGWRLAPDGTAADSWSLRSEETGSGETASVEIALPHAGTLSFDWRVSSAVRKHFACYYVDGTRQDRISGETDWATETIALGDGPHVVRWTYEKSSTAASGDDAAFLDNVDWSPLTLDEALDADGVAWRTEGGAAWVPVVSVSSDGQDAAKSGSLVGEETSRLVATVAGPGTLSWLWKTDVLGLAGVDVYLDGTMLDEPYLMDEPDWTAASLRIGSEGAHRVEFRFWNGGTEATIGDCAYIDSVVWDSDSVLVENVAIPKDWIRANAAGFLAAAGGDYAAAARATAANGRDKVWECYVAGLDPTNAASRFLATIGFDENGVPDIGWTPDLGGARDYAVDGKHSLTNDWSIPDADSRFFRVRVAMPGGFRSYTISFDTDGGSTLAAITAAYGSPVTAPEPPTKNGYDFAGWSPPLPATMPARNLTAVAQWTPIDLFVDAESGDDANDGRQRATAKKTIQAAIDAAPDGGTIHVGPGVYGTIVNSGSKALRIESEAGPERTIIDGQGRRRCAKLSNQEAASDPCATLVGFTLRNGCRNDAGVGGAYLGRLESCVVSNCVAANEAAAAANCELLNCLVVGNVASNLNATTRGYICNNAVLRNCTVVGNRTVEGNGAPLFRGGVLRNCIVWDNDRFGTAVFSSDTTVDHVATDAAGEGDIPLSSSPFSDAANGDYRLAAGSPCIDAGAGTFEPDATDLAGNPRVSGTAVDAGCYEWQPVPPSPSGLAIRYYDIDESGYETWIQSETAMTNYFAGRTATMDADTTDFGTGLATGHSDSNPLGYDDLERIAEFGMTALETGVCRFHGKYANSDTEEFAAFMTGTLTVSDSGTYSFASVADDYVVIYVDGSKIANSQWATIASGSMFLAAGEHAISVGYYESAGGQGLTVQWKKPGDSSYAPIPQSMLSH